MLARWRLLWLLILLILLFPQALLAQRIATVSPYLGLEMGAVAQDREELVTYLRLSGGVDARVAVRRTEAQITLRYDREIGLSGERGDTDALSGVARADVDLGDLTLRTGGLATRTSEDAAGRRVSRAASPGSQSQLYSAYAAPTLRVDVAGLARATLSYRLGYTALTAAESEATAPSSRAAFDESVSQAVAVAIGQGSRDRPFGWAVEAGHEDERGGPLDQRFQASQARLELIRPISRSVALTGRLGYEAIEVSEKPVLRDGAGAPLFDGDGRPRSDPAGRRQLAYRTDGLIFDVGVLWRPSRRTNLDLRIGQRYGSLSVAGSFSWARSEDSGIGVSVYDRVSGFGGYVTGRLAALPTGFTSRRNALGGGIEGCAFGGAGTLCFGELLQSTGAEAFRARGASLALAGRRGGWESGGAIGYARRDLFRAPLAVGGERSVAIDEEYFVTGFLGRRLDDQSALNGSVFAGIGSDAVGSGLVNAGASASYQRQFGRTLSALAAIGIDYNEQGTDEDVTVATAQLGLSYRF